VDAISIVPRAQEWLLETTQAWVIYASDKVCNLINSRDRLLSITTPHVGHDPLSLMVPAIDLSKYIDAETRVDLFPSRLQLGTLEINTRSAEKWDPRPSWSSLRQRMPWVQDGLQIANEVLARIAPPESLAGLVVHLPETRSSFEGKVQRLAREPARRLTLGLQLGDVDLCIQSATKLAGLGVGYTPDGDDWTVGSLLATWMSKVHREASRLCTAIVNAVIPLTTPISAAWLHAASQGECAEPWHLFFDSLLRGRENSIQEAAQRIILIGHTSGASAMAGFLALFKTKM
jgi:hypothetical protein